MEPYDEAFLTQVMRHLFQTRGIDLTGYSQSFVYRAIRKRIGRSGSVDQHEYLRKLQASDDETSQLLGALSINVTEFFRDRGAFEAFSECVLRPLIQSKSGANSILRVWSAGCATGQEVYTVALCLLEESKRIKTQPPMLSVVGTDISTQAIAKAKGGMYTREEVKGVSDRLLHEYFVRKPEGYEVGEKLARITRFHRENLLDKPEQKHFDAVVCRNVLIYFSRAMHDKVTMNLYHALRQGGYLMLGRTETLMGAPRGVFEVVNLENRILRKKI
jgi:chemotaxis protein methyltransferase CheR